MSQLEIAAPLRFLQWRTRQIVVHRVLNAMRVLYRFIVAPHISIAALCLIEWRSGR